MPYSGTNNFSQWDTSKPAGTEEGNVLAPAVQEVKRVTQAVVEKEHNSDGTHTTGAIVTGYIADAAISTVKIADGAVTSGKLAAGVIGTTAITDGSVTTAKIATGAVTATQIAANAVGTAQLASSSVTVAQMGGATSAGQVLIGQAGGGFLQLVLSGALSVNATTGAVTLNNPISIDIAIIQDIKSPATDGGTFTAGSLVVRDLNSISDPSALVTISANKFMLPIGKYIIWAEAPAYVTGDHQAIIYDETNAIIKLNGSSCSNGNSDPTTTRSTITGFIDLSAASTPTQFSVQHQCSVTQATNGLGKASSFTVAQEVYTQVMVIKIA